MIFDTNIFIYADRGVESAKMLLLDADHRKISAVTYMEYVPFCRSKKELSLFNGLLKSLKFEILDIDSDISFSARSLVQRYALSHSVEMGDALIAATAMKHSEILCTGNAKHFKPIKGLDLSVFKP